MKIPLETELEQVNKPKYWLNECVVSVGHDVRVSTTFQLIAKKKTCEVGTGWCCYWRLCLGTVLQVLFIDYYFTSCLG